MCFYENLVVLLDDYLTQEITIQRGFKQGHSMAHFLCLLVVESLNGFLLPG